MGKRFRSIRSRDFARIEWNTILKMDYITERVTKEESLRVSFWIYSLPHVKINPDLRINVTDIKSMINLIEISFSTLYYSISLNYSINFTNKRDYLILRNCSATRIHGPYVSRGWKKIVGQEGNQKEYPITGELNFHPYIPLHSLRFTIGRGIPPFEIHTERNTK